MKQLLKTILKLLASINPEESLNDKQQPSKEQRERFMKALELEERNTVSPQTRHLFHQALDAHRNGGKL
ncbi:hypothetical protein [Variovorax sp. W2I14]|uniref:hypothetical protein n=1 Tax=Variovorax sp. W2I14 TaxID=3042290 RepID=UPI003D1D1537